jgi:hypothetical protein
MKYLAENFSTAFTRNTRTSILAMSDFSSAPSRLSQNGSYSSGGSHFRNFKRFTNKSSILPFAIVAVVVIVIAGVLITKATKNHPASTTLGASTSNQANVAKPVSQETLNRNFDFPLKDATGKVVSKISYEIQSAELDNQIVIKGQIATAVQGKSFLVLNLKITNTYDKPVQLNTRDYVRLVVDNASDKLAADIHNDPVDIQAISTKYTRIGFPIDVNAKDLKLEVGEIDGPKQTIQLNLN